MARTEVVLAEEHVQTERDRAVVVGVAGGGVHEAVEDQRDDQRRDRLPARRLSDLALDLSSAFGRTLIGIRENEVRMELLGYNVPAYKTAIFSVCGAMAGLAGCLFANWAEIVTPSVFSLGTTAEVLIWVIVGGLGTLVGPMIAAVALGSLKLELGHQTTVDNSLVLGAILILVVLLIPRGFAPSFVAWRRRFAQSQVHRRLARGTRRNSRWCRRSPCSAGPARSMSERPVCR